MVGENREAGQYNILSILAFVFAFIFFPVGFILGIISLSQIKKTNERGHGLAIAAIIISVLSFVFLILFFIFWILLISVAVLDESSMKLNEKCLAVPVLPTEVSRTMPEVFDVTLSRPSSEDYYLIGGVKMIFSNLENKTYFYDAPGNIFEETIRVSIPEEDMESPNKVDVIVYFLDEEGNQEVCPNSSSLSF